MRRQGMVEDDIKLVCTCIALIALFPIGTFFHFIEQHYNDDVGTQLQCRVAEPVLVSAARAGSHLTVLVNNMKRHRWKNLNNCPEFSE